MSITAITSIAITVTTLAGHAAEIKRLGKRAVTDVIEIGKLLSEAKNIAGRADFLPWLDHEFGWSEDTAENFIRLSKLSHDFPKLSEMNFPLSGLYLLAAPSTPQEARTEIIERAEAGEPVSVAEVKQTIETAKGGRQQPARKGRAIEFPPETIRQIKHLVECGISPTEIATKLGVTPASLQTACSRAGISLRPPTQKRVSRDTRSDQNGKQEQVPEAASPPDKDTGDDIGPDNGELAQLRALVEELQDAKRQLEIKITGLESEIAELRRPPSEEANGEAVDADAAALGSLLKLWDRASQPVRERFMARAELVLDPLAIPPYLDRRTKEARHG